MQERSQTLPAAAGIDAGQRYLTSACRPAPSFGPNRPEAFPALFARLKREGVERVALEAIGSYTHALVQALAAAGFAVGLVNLRRIRAFRSPRQTRQDRRRDAGLITRFADRMRDAFRPLPTPTRSRLRRCPTAGASSPK